MKKALEFLQECGTYYLATVEGDQPRVRPFGGVFEYEGRLYFTTSNQKNVYKQMLENPKVELCGMSSKGQWLRVTGEVAVDDRHEVKELALKELPSLNQLYSLDDGVFTVVYFTKGTGVISSFTAAPETFSL